MTNESENSQDPSNQEKKRPKKAPQNKGKKMAFLMSASIVLIALIVFFWWFFWARFAASTEDAYVHGNQVALTPQIPGIVNAVNVNDTEMVVEGQVLVTLDETDRKIALDSAENNLAESVRTVTKMFEHVYALAAQFELKQAQLFSAEVDFLDRKNVVTEGAVSDEDFIHAESNFYASKAAVQVVKFELMQAISLVQNTKISDHPLVERAKEKVRQAWVDLQRCTLKSPVRGIIAQRSVQVGESVVPSRPLLAIIPLDQIWVNANFKEDDLASIRIGQSVSLTSDMYGNDVQYTGEVIGIGSGTGAVFSALPPQNATGNWIKIVQRVPVRISINSEQLRRYPLFLGLTMNASVDIRDKQGSRLPENSAEKPLYVTTIFDDQILGAELVIERIVMQNMTFDLEISHDVLSLVGR